MNGAVFFDYDGTLTDGPSGVNETTAATRRAVARLRENGYLAVLDSEYYILTRDEVYSFDLSDWSLAPAGASFAADYAKKDVSETAAELVEGLGPVQCGYDSRGIVMLDRYDYLIWAGDPEGTIRNRVTRNRAADFNLAGEWIFYHNSDDGGRLWCVRRDGADDHRI